MNGQKLFYACEGKGKPVVLIHGNSGSHTDLETTQRQLAQAGYLVYALDERGQGANVPIDEYHYKDMACDIKAFIDAKNLKKPAVFGWSDGGIVALLLESTYPGTCSLLVTSGANVTAENAIEEKAYKDIFGSYEHADSMPPLLRMMYLEPNMTQEDLRRIKIPVLVCAGENDLITPEHTQYIAESLPKGEKKIVAGEDHGSHIWHNKLMGQIILEYFNKQGY
ncbi:MAG: alpha/beta hydrolase [Bacteroidales bacterium]|nr:alpha/beta hydrolase [Bacteroidales bacterium]